MYFLLIIVSFTFALAEEIDFFDQIIKKMESQLESQIVGRQPVFEICNNVTVWNSKILNHPKEDQIIDEYLVRVLDGSYFAKIDKILYGLNGK